MLNINGMVKVPWKLQFTGIFRAQTSQHRTMLIRMHLGERYKLRLYLRCSTYFNRSNPAAVQQLPEQPVAVGQITQRLPGGEG